MPRARLVELHSHDGADQRPEHGVGQRRLQTAQGVQRARKPSARGGSDRQGDEVAGAGALSQLARRVSQPPAANRKPDAGA